MADIDQECGAATEGQPLLVSTPPKSRFIRFFIVALAVGVTGTLALTKKLLDPGTNIMALPLAKLETEPIEIDCSQINTEEACETAGEGWVCWWVYELGCLDRVACVGDFC